MSEDYEHERTATREEAAAILHELADGLAAGTLRFGPDEDPTDVDVPGTVDLELELETDRDRRGVEVELEWATESGTEATGEASDSPVEEGAEADVEGEVEAGAEEVAEPPAEDEAEPLAAQETESDRGPDAVDSEVTEAAGGATVETVPVVPGGTLESLARFEVYRDRGGEWRWRLRHRNGNVIATSGEGYTRKEKAVKGLRSVMRNSPAADVVEE